MDNPLLSYLLADAPLDFAPARASKHLPACAECGLTGGVLEDYRSVAPAGVLLCQVCVLARTAAWEPERVRLALVPELAQGTLNALVTRLTVNLLRARAGEPVPVGIEVVLQAKLLEGLQERAAATRAALPWAASPVRLRHTLRALPAGARSGVLAELAGLRYLPEPTDPALTRFFNRRRALAAD